PSRRSIGPRRVRSIIVPRGGRSLSVNVRRNSKPGSTHGKKTRRSPSRGNVWQPKPEIPMFPSSIPRSHATRAALALALTLAAPACSTAPIAPPDDPPPPLLEIAMTGTGDGQGGVEGVALPLPLQVRVTQGGAPVAGVPIRWTTTSGSLTVSGSFTNHLG